MKVGRRGMAWITRLTSLASSSPLRIADVSGPMARTLGRSSSGSRSMTAKGMLEFAEHGGVEDSVLASRPVDLQIPQYRNT